MTKPPMKRRSPRTGAIIKSEPDNAASMIIPDGACSSSAASLDPDACTGRPSKKTKANNGIRSINNNSNNNITTIVRPMPEECEYAVQTLGELHPGVLEATLEIKKSRKTKLKSDGSERPVIVKSEDDGGNDTFQTSSCGFRQTIMDGVVSTMLSQNTTAANSTRAFANLKKAFPDWNTVAYLETTTPIETAVRVAGLAKIRAQRILTICKTLKKERGSVTLEYLRDCTSQEIKDDLLRFPGLGIKTISCVLMFTLGREDEFPVDTHVLRISQQNRWVPSSFKRDDAYEYLNRVVPDHLKLDLHCLLVQHGRECHRCAARGKPQFPPKDGSKLDCPLVHLNSIATAGIHGPKKATDEKMAIKVQPTQNAGIKMEK